MKLQLSCQLHFIKENPNGRDFKSSLVEMRKKLYKYNEKLNKNNYIIIIIFLKNEQLSFDEPLQTRNPE